MAAQILTKKRAHLKSRLTRFVTFLNECENSEQKRQEIPVRLKKIELMWKEFDEIQSGLEDSVEGEIDNGEREAFEDKFYNSVTKAKGMIPQVHVPLQGAQPPLVNQPINAIQPKKMRLPTIEIPKFDGTWEKWLPFRDTFTSMIHDNASLPSIDKLHYLRWALEGGIQINRSIRSN